MKSTNIDVLKSTKVIFGELPPTTPVGFAKDVHGNFFTMFLATDPATGEFVMSKDGQRHKFNFRKALPRS